MLATLAALTALVLVAGSRGGTIPLSSLQEPSFPKQPVLHVLPTTNSPAMDGVLDDKCWQEATRASGFMSLDGHWCEDQTTSYVTYDSSNLYIGYLCNETLPDRMRANIKEHDNVQVFSDECVEFFLDTNHDHQTYYHFMVNSLGTCYEAYVSQGEGDKTRDSTWNPAWQVATSVGEKTWTVEMSIPFDSLGTTMPAPGEMWGINLNREHWQSERGGGPNSWAMVNSFNDPASFGNIVFGVAEEVSYSFVSFGDNLLRVKLKNGTETIVDLEAQVAVEDLPPAIERLQLGPKGEEQVDLKYDLQNMESASLAFKISAPGTGRVYHFRKGVVLGRPAEIGLSLDRYYYTPDNDGVRVNVKKRKAGTGSIRVDVRKHFDSEALLSQDVPLREGQDDYSVSIDIAGLEMGRYIATASTPGSDRKKGYTAHAVFYMNKDYEPLHIPRPVKTTGIRNDGVILVNETPFCPFFVAINSAKNSPTPPKEIGFNVKGYYIETGLVREGLDVPWVTRQEKGEIFIDLPEEEKIRQHVRKHVIARKSDPSLFEWFILYEAQTPMRRGGKPVDNAEELAKISQFVNRIDPNHLTAIEIDKLTLLTHYKHSADIIEVASWGSSYSKSLIPDLAGDVDRIRTALGKEKPFFFWIGSAIPSESWRNAETIRCASYLALMHGARGLAFHMGHEGLSTSATRHWSVYGGLSREVETIFPILIASEPDNMLQLTVQPAAIDLCLRESQGHIYLFAVNTTGRILKATFNCDDERLGNTVHLLFENREIKTDGNAFTDTFTDYEPHVYEITSGVAHRNDVF